MNQTIDIAKAEFSKLQGNGDAQVDSAAQPDGAESTSARGEQGQAGQFGQAGQYGAVTGAGFGGGLAKGPGGQQQQQASGQPGEERKHRGSIYEGMAEDDSTATGGYGRNAKGSSFSRANQMGTDESPNVFGDDDEEEHAGYKTGTSTPGYRQEGDVDHEAAENRVKNQNLNTYGAQADDRGSKGNDYNEADTSPRI